MNLDLHTPRRFVRGAAWALAGLALAALAACGTVRDAAVHDAPAARQMPITLLALNDFHGHLQPSDAPYPVRLADGRTVRMPAGGAAPLASLVARLRATHRNTVLVAAGDLVGASPLVSSLFSDEPTIEALNQLGLDFASTGNHEYDQGAQELLRLQHGGCERHTNKPPCRLGKPFAGANFQYLTANTLRRGGGTLLPPTGIRYFEQDGVRIGVGFIGLTLKGTPRVVRPSGVRDLRFTDEARAANAQIPRLRAAGADVIVVLIHEGATSHAPLQDSRCEGLSGDLMPIVARLSPEVDVVVSGHTHQAYLCDYRHIDPSRPLLITSAGSYGALLTEIDLTVDLDRHRVVARHARQHVVRNARGTDPAASTDTWPIQPAEPGMVALIKPYAEAAAQLADAPVGHLAAPALRQLLPNGESVLGRIVADATLAATRAPADGGAQIAFVNSGGVRADLIPDDSGQVRYGQTYSVQPFGNTLMSLTLSGAQLHALLEQQFASGTNTVAHPRILQVSQGFSYTMNPHAPAGARVADLRLNSAPICPTHDYRIGVQSYLATGGDNFSVFTQGRDVRGGGLDIDALDGYLSHHGAAAPLALPLQLRITLQAADDAAQSVSSTPPSTRRAAPLVADACAEQA